MGILGILKTLYIMVCTFLIMFMLGFASFYGGKVPTYSQSHLPLLQYLTYFAATVTIFLFVLIAVGFGMYYLYRLIFRGK